MLNHLKRIRGDKFLQESTILTCAFFAFNAANFFYHFIAARKLGPEDYAVVASLFSLIYILSVGSNVVQTGITKFTSTFYAKNQMGKIKSLKKRALKRLFTYSLGLFLLYSALSPFIAKFLHIEVLPVIITGILILFILTLPVNRGILQGMQRFRMLGMNLVLEGFVKLALAIAFIYIGWGINGAVGAAVLGVAAAFILSFVKIKTHEKSFDSKEIYSYSLPVLFAMTSLTAMYSLDVVLIKHLLPSSEAGLYSAISLLGKIVFFGATAISLVMFSKVSELHAKNKEHRSVLNKALAFSGLIGLLLILVYGIAGKLIVSIIFGEQYQSIAPLLWIFAVFMLFLSLTYLLTMYYLSIGKKKFIFVLLAFNVIQVVGIYLLASSMDKAVYFLSIFSIVLFTITFLFNKK